MCDIKRCRQKDIELSIKHKKEKIYLCNKDWLLYCNNLIELDNRERLRKPLSIPQPMEVQSKLKKW